MFDFTGDMALYHGSLEIVKTPEIRIGERFLDFGYGFYTTTNREQASVWGAKLRLRKGVNKSYVSAYTFDEKSARTNLKIIEFSEANREWLEFVCKNRKGDYKENYDIVIGPVADDSVYEVVRFYELGVYDLDEAIKHLKIEKLFNQVLFHTKKSLQYLKFNGATEEIKNE